MAQRRPWYRQLQWLILSAMAAGVALALVANAAGFGEAVAAAADPVGTVFINLLKMIMVPLVFTSIVTGVTGLGDPRRLGRIGLKTVLYYVATTGLAVIVGLVLVTVIRPGEREGLTEGDAVGVVRQALPAPEADAALVSFVQSVADAPEIDLVASDGPFLVRELRFGVLSPFQRHPAAPLRLEVRTRPEQGPAHTLATADLALAPGGVYQVVVAGRARDETVSVRVEPLHDKRGDVWVVHAAAGIPEVRVVDGQGRLLTEALRFGDAALDVPDGPAAFPLRLQRGGVPLAVLGAERADAPGGTLFLMVGRPLAAQPKELAEILIGVVPKNVFEALSTDDVLSLIFFALVLGLALALSGEPARPVREFMDGAFHVVMKVTDWIMWTAPLGVAALLAETVVEMGPDVLGRLAVYMATVLAGLAFHALVTLPLLLWLLARTSPLAYAKALSRALLTAFSTSSSSATLPVTLEDIQRNAGVSNRVASFVLPLGATVNMDGTALYEAVAALFIAQIYQIELSFAEQLVIFVTATLAAIGAAGVPSAGLVTMVLVLRAVGLPEDGIGLIVAVDRVLDMCRTTVNVWGDAVGARIIAGSEGEVRK